MLSHKCINEVQILIFCFILRLETFKHLPSWSKTSGMSSAFSSTLRILELWIKEFIVHVNYMAWQKVNNAHKHTFWKFEHFPLLIHFFWENWERESWFPVVELLSVFGIQSLNDISGYKTNPKNSIIFSKVNIKTEFSFVFGLCFCILQDSLARSHLDHFFSFVERVCRSNFCICMICFHQMNFECWSCKFHFSVSASKAFLAQSTSCPPPETLITV